MIAINYDITECNDAVNNFVSTAGANSVMVYFF